ncbi:CLUMA_CG019098, isoform A [Clunio marinus]|uniref:CLUMA_CG019098, isoform A n=1 Tax=Clunio marinus TaxID=568069 RepID=A0A1J1J1E8_9DIPT|nr:CLUMA_CG019098, isoform A [Clunio marinus]
MKTRFNTVDIVCALTELKRFVGFRVNQIYDIDNKTYLIRLQGNDEKTVLLLESGNRIHTTAFEWPKNVSPSGFTMKMRKHLKNKRLEAINQLGIDRIIDLQFGTGEACYHVILELYDRGNIILCDYEYIILNVLRPHVEGEEIRFAVREKYPLSRARANDGPPSMTFVKEKIKEARPGDSLKTILNPILPFGAALIDHALIENHLNDVKIGGEKPEEEATGEDKKKKKKKNRNKEQAMREFIMDQDFPILMNSINDMYTMMQKAMEEPSSGFIIQKKETKPTQDGPEDFYYTNIEYHPFLFSQNMKEPIREFPSFLQAVDEFYSNVESQKIDLKAFQQEREALKKLSNVRQDHAQRLEELAKVQQIDRKKAELITRNQVLVDSVIYAMRALLAKQLSWLDIKDLIKERQEQNDRICSLIKRLKLETNQITLKLSDPFANLDDEEDEDDDDQREEDEHKLDDMEVDIDLGLSAYSNATRYYDQKRGAAKKEQKTIEASGKALKSAEKKTQQTLKDVRIQTTISKARKTFWFEKFYWFISSENYLVIGGRDQQQNELIVKRYLRQTDVYVHAEIQGASSVVIKNPSGGEIPPKTLLEAGTMAISYSVSWEAKVVTSAYWVKAEQVSKTAPTGEYLSTGSFMIRGKKNFLPPCHLILGLSFLFKLEDGSVERHRGERKVRKFDDDASSVMTENEQLESINEEEIPVVSDGDDDSAEDEIPTENVENLKIEVSESDSDDGGEKNFPDTHIKVEHTTGQVDIKPDPKLERLLSEENQEEATLIQAAPLKVKAYEKKLKQQKKKQPVEQPQQKQQEKDDGKNQPKRGQKGKLKKIKEKYKDQDEEDRAMIMEILKPSGSGKDSRKTKKQEEEENYKKSAARRPQPKQKTGEEMDDTPAADEVDMLDSLTGIPVDEDELLFAIPVVAPYQTLHNYKFKVKLTPGTGKRGKAAKTAVAMFLKDKTCTSREKDLLKSVKDEVLARNIPGKVKISAPQLLKMKK